MRTEKRSAFLSGLCGVAVALGLMASSAGALVTTERGASILAFPKILADGSADTIVQITNISNNMVHAHCFYVNAQLDTFGNPLWQVTDFSIWLTKQQPTHWQVGEGRFVNPSDNTLCIQNGQYYPSQECDGAGIDPGAIPPVPTDFIGELKCVEVDVAGNPIGGNHLKGEATIITTDSDVSKYNAVGIQGTDLAGETGNELLLNQPNDADGGEPVGQYNACPNVLLLNHLAEGVTDPVLYANELGGTCAGSGDPCYSDSDCETTCNDAPQILDGANQVDLRSASLTDLTLIPCTQDFENSVSSSVTVQFEIFNEFEQRLSASTTVDCWANFYLFEVDSPLDPERSVFSFATLGTVAAHTRITPNPDDGAVVGVAGVTRADSQGNLTRAAFNIHMEGDRFSASGGEITDVITLPAR
jgi:hypothetical protein